MAYVNTSHFNEGETETSNYTSLALPDEGNVAYSTIKYDRSTEMIGLPSTSLEHVRPIPRQNTNIHTRDQEPDVIENNSDQQLGKCTCQKSKLKLIMVIVGMVAIAAASSTITALLLKQDFDNHLSNIREEMDSIKQNIGQDIENNWSTWGSWGVCSTTCGGGIKERNRTCDNPAPSLLGKACTGHDNMYVSCNTKACPEPLVYFTVNTPNGSLVSERPIFLTIIANVGGAYNETTGLFVCPISGLYQFYFSFMHNTNTKLSCWLIHNYYYWLTEVYAGASNGHWKQTSAYVHVELKQGDTVYAGNCNNNWNNVYTGYSYSGSFTGSLIHAT